MQTCNRWILYAAINGTVSCDAEAGRHFLQTHVFRIYCLLQYRFDVNEVVWFDLNFKFSNLFFSAKKKKVRYVESSPFLFAARVSFSYSHGYLDHGVTAAQRAAEQMADLGLRPPSA